MMTTSCEVLVDAVLAALGRISVDISIQHGQVTLVVPSDRITDVMFRLKNSEGTQFHQLMDVCGVDYPECPFRFNVAYQLLSLSHNWRVTVLTEVAEGDEIPSVTSVYFSAGWFEREVFDMYGIPFSGHPDLRRILTDYNFEGYPLRKDFPLSGHVQVRYDDLERKVKQEPVDIETPHRTYNTVSPWQGVAEVQKRGDGHE